MLQMKIDRIGIQTPNKKYATDIAMLIDKPEFLYDIQRLRAEWDIINLLDPAAIYDGFLEKYLSTDNGKINDETEIQKRLSKFIKDIDGILKKFRRDRSFKRVVEYALATGVIPDRIYKRCYFDKVMIGEPEDLSKPEKYQYVIVMSPRTEKKEVEEAYDEFQDFIRGHEPKHELDDGVLGKIDWQKSEGAEDFAEYEHFIKGPVYDAADITKYQTMSKQLERTREWYWIRNQKYFNGEVSKPLSYPDVLDEWLNTCPLYKEGVAHDLNDAECPKCTFFEKKKRKDKRVKEGGGSYNHVEQALDAYTSLLNNS